MHTALIVLIAAAVIWASHRVIGFLFDRAPEVVRRVQPGPVPTPRTRVPS